MSGVSEANGMFHRWQDAQGSLEGVVISHAVSNSHRAHKMWGSSQVSAFMLFGPAQYHLVWADGKAWPEAISQGAMRHLRWTLVTAQAVSQATSQAGNRRRTAGVGASVGSATLIAGTPLRPVVPVRTAVFKGVLQPVAETRDDDTRLRRIRRARPRSTGIAEAKASGQCLRIRLVPVTPVMQANASVMRSIFKINATADAPDSRLILVGFSDRELLLPAPDREYYVR